MVYIWGMYLDEKAFIFVLIRIITQNKQMKNDVSKLIKKSLTQSPESDARECYIFYKSDLNVTFRKKIWGGNLGNYARNNR